MNWVAPKFSVEAAVLVATGRPEAGVTCAAVGSMITVVRTTAGFALPSAAVAGRAPRTVAFTVAPLEIQVGPA